MGHVYSVFVAGGAATTGSSAIPHFGQSPGSCWRTSGSIGQVYSFEAFRGGAEGVGGAFDGSCWREECAGAGAICTACEDAGAMRRSDFGIKYFAGSALNFSWHPRQQK